MLNKAKHLFMIQIVKPKAWLKLQPGLVGIIIALNKINKITVCFVLFEFYQNGLSFGHENWVHEEDGVRVLNKSCILSICCLITWMTYDMLISYYVISMMTPSGTRWRSWWRWCQVVKKMLSLELNTFDPTYFLLLW